MSQYFYLDDNGTPVGPFDLAQMKKLIADVVLDPKTFVTCRPGPPAWSPLEKFDEFKDVPPLAASETTSAQPEKEWQKETSKLGKLLSTELDFTGASEPAPEKGELPWPELAAARPKLAPCPDCGTEVSTSALACPKCGRKMKSEQTAIGLVAAIILGLVIAGFILYLLSH